MIRQKSSHPYATWLKEILGLSSTLLHTVSSSSSPAGSPSAGVPCVPGAHAAAGQHSVQRGAPLADAAPRGDQVGVATLVGEGVGRAAGRDTAAERTLPPLPLLLLQQVLPTVPLDLRANTQRVMLLGHHHSLNCFHSCVPCAGSRQSRSSQTYPLRSQHVTLAVQPSLN